MPVRRCYVAQQHVTSNEGGQLERDGSEITEGTIRWGLNHQYRWPGSGDNFRPWRRAPVNPPEEGPPGPVQQLMGKVQHVWNHAGMKQSRIHALEGEKDQAREQCDKMATAQTVAQQEIGQLRASNEQLQRENEHLRQELLAAKATPRPTGPPSVSSESRNPSGLTDQEQIRHLTATVTRIRGEREAVRRENEKYKAANEKWRTDAIKEKQRNASTISDMYNRWREAEDRLSQLPAPTRQLPSHQGMGGYVYVPAAEGQASHPAMARDPQGPPVLPTPPNRPARLGATNSQHAPQLTPHRSASETSQETVGREEAMESDSQAESESQEQQRAQGSGGKLLLFPLYTQPNK